MSGAEKPHFPKRVLEMSENAQRMLGDSAVSRELIKVFTGSSCPSYQQLNWWSGDMVSTDITKLLDIPGDPSVKRMTPARLWHKAAVLATENLKPDPVWEPSGVDAVAYISEGVAHIGTAPNNTNIFNELNANEFAIGMRLGSGALKAAMGVWLADEQHFIGATNQRIVVPHTDTGDFEKAFPNIVLI